MHNGNEIRVNVTRLRKHLATIPEAATATIDLEERLIERFITNNGIEKHRLTRLIALSDEEFAKLPLPIVILFRDYTWVLADGNHTMCAAYFRKLTQMDAYKVKEKTWRKFLMPNVGNVNYQGFSGIF